MACAGFFWRPSSVDRAASICTPALASSSSSHWPCFWLLFWLEEREETPEDKSSAIWSLGNGDALSLSFPHGKWGIFHFINDSAESRVYQYMCSWWLLSALHLVTSTPVPGRVGIPGRLPVKSPFSQLWLAPSCVAYNWFVGRTHLGPTVSESCGCFKSASWIIILWHMATSFMFPPRASGSKVSPQRTLVLSLQESLTMQHSCPQAAPRPRGPPDWCEVRENSCPVGWSTRDSPWSLPCEMPWLQRDYRRD